MLRIMQRRVGELLDELAYRVGVEIAFEQRFEAYSQYEYGDEETALMWLSTAVVESAAIPRTLWAVYPSQADRVARATVFEAVVICM